MRRRSIDGGIVGGCIFVGIWILWGLGSLAVTLGLIYAAFHFIVKFW